MAQFHLGLRAMGDIRFGLSPLCELSVSLSALKDPGRYPLQLRWLRHAQRVREQVDQAVLSALIDDRHWMPEFLTPRPRSPLTRLDSELEALLRIEPAVFQAQIEAVHGRVPRVLAGPPAEAVRRVVEALRTYWDLCFEPHWHRMRTVLEADVVDRGRQIAQGGMHVMLNDLSSVVSYDRDVISVDLAAVPDLRTEVGEDGLTLVPTMFARTAWISSATEPPMIVYPARGQAALWEAEQVPDAQSVMALLGRVRARLLMTLDQPASSTELAVRFGVTTSAVNQHLRVLRDGGLLTSARHGRSVLYLRSALGSQLLAGPGTASP